MTICHGKHTYITCHNTFTSSSWGSWTFFFPDKQDLHNVETAVTCASYYLVWVVLENQEYDRHRHLHMLIPV